MGFYVGTPKWDRLHMRTVCTRLRTKQTEQFDAVCAAHGLTRYEALRRFCVAVLRDERTLTELDWR